MRRSPRGSVRERFAICSRPRKVIRRSRARGNARQNKISRARVRAHPRCGRPTFFAHSRRSGDDDSYSFRGSGRGRRHNAAFACVISKDVRAIVDAFSKISN